MSILRMTPILLVIFIAGCGFHGKHGGVLPESPADGRRHTKGITPSSVQVRNYVKIHVYMGQGIAGTGCDGAQPATNVIQSVTTAVQTCTSWNPQTVCPDTGQTPPSGALGCSPVYYKSMTLNDCGDTETSAYYNANYNSETFFLHKASPFTQANRMDGTATVGKCPAPGTTTASNYFYWDGINATTAEWWLRDWFESSSQIHCDPNVLTMADNIEYGRPYDGTVPAEFSSVSAWRTNIGYFLGAMNDSNPASPGDCQGYGIIANALGPGGGNYGPNNGVGAGEGVVNEAIDITDLCDGDSYSPWVQPQYLSAPNIVAFLSERPWEEGNGTRLLTGGNPKILVNTSSLLYSDTNCAGDLETLNAANTHTLRMVTKAMEMILTSNGYDGGLYSHGIMEWRYTIGLSATELPIFPEDLLILVNPVKNVGAWQWSGQWDGGGCSDGVQGALSSDIGGTHDVTLARACGRIGNWDGGYPAPIYFREGTCYKQGQLLGACAGVINLGTTAFTLQQSDFTNGSLYKHRLSPTGGELAHDPVTGGTICSAANCNGVWGTSSLTGTPWTYSLPSCNQPSPDPGTYSDSYDCALVLLP